MSWEHDVRWSQIRRDEVGLHPVLESRRLRRHRALLAVLCCLEAAAILILAQSVR